MLRLKLIHVSKRATVVKPINHEEWIHVFAIQCLKLISYIFHKLYFIYTDIAKYISTSRTGGTPTLNILRISRMFSVYESNSRLPDVHLTTSSVWSITVIAVEMHGGQTISDRSIRTGLSKDRLMVKHVCNTKPWYASPRLDSMWSKMSNFKI